MRSTLIMQFDPKPGLPANSFGDTCQFDFEFSLEDAKEVHGDEVEVEKHDSVLADLGI